MFQWFELVLKTSILILWPFSSSLVQGILLYPENTVFQNTLGVSVPVAMSKSGGVVFSFGFQFNFVMPWNLSQFEPTIIPARKMRHLELRDAYTTIEHLLHQHGWVDGRECLLRTICELAETPLNRTGQDVLEEVIHLILTPSEDLPAVSNSNRETVDILYREAEVLGRSGGDCILSYPNCIDSPLESFTELVSL